MYSPDPRPNAVKLVGGLPGTATFLYTGPGGDLVIELYDHSAQAESSFGNDVAFLMQVAAEYKPQLLALLGGLAQPQAACNDLELFERLRDQFRDYYEVQRWLEVNGIPYRQEFDSWA